MDNSGTVFPLSDGIYLAPYGLTKRELFAAMALQGMVSTSARGDPEENVARMACVFADSLLAELAKGKKR